MKAKLGKFNTLIVLRLYLFHDHGLSVARVRETQSNRPTYL